MTCRVLFDGFNVLVSMPGKTPVVVDKSLPVAYRQHVQSTLVAITSLTLSGYYGTDALFQEAWISLFDASVVDKPVHEEAESDPNKVY